MKSAQRFWKYVAQGGRVNFGCQDNRVTRGIMLTEVHFASLLSDEFTNLTVINPSDWKFANRTFVD